MKAKALKRSMGLLISIVALHGCTGKTEKDIEQGKGHEQGRQDHLEQLASSIKTPIEIAPGTVLRSVKAMDGNLLEFNYDMNVDLSKLKNRLDENKSELIRSACQSGHPVKEMGTKARYVWSIDGKQAMTLEIDDSMCQPHLANTAAKEAK